MTNVIIYSPEGKPVNLGYVRDALAHVARRGYTMVAFSSELADVDEALTTRRADVVVFGCDIQRVGSDDPSVATQVVRPPGLTRERVRDIIDHGATPPAGIDPETVTALRQLARLLDGNSGNPSRYVNGQGVHKGVLRRDV